MPSEQTSCSAPSSWAARGGSKRCVKTIDGLGDGHTGLRLKMKMMATLQSQTLQIPYTLGTTLGQLGGNPIGTQYEQRGTTDSMQKGSNLILTHAQNRRQCQSRITAPAEPLGRMDY